MAQLFPACVHSLHGANSAPVFATSSLFPPGTSSIQVHLVLLKPCLLREGAVNLAHAPKNLAADPADAGPGAAATLVPALMVPGTLLSQTISLPSDFSMSSTILACNLHIC